MFIDLSSYSAPLLDPSRYPTTLVIGLDFDEDFPDSGVFCGVHEALSDIREEKGQKVPLLQDDPEAHGASWIGRQFLIDRSPITDPTTERLCYRWEYLVINWDGLFSKLPYGYRIRLQALRNDDASFSWSVTFTESRQHVGPTVILADYLPDAVGRGAVQLAPLG